MLSILCLLALAAAQEPEDLDEDLDLDTPEPAPVVAPAAPVEPTEGKAREMTYEVSFRGRYVSVPRGILDAWFTDAAHEGWPLTSDRPFPKAGVYGVDVAVQGQKRSLALFYVELFQAFLGEGYWDDHDEPEVFNDGKWLRPARFFGAVVIGANGLYDAPIVKPAQTNGMFAMSFQVGGGLGIAALVGSIDLWELDTTTGTPSYQRLDEPPEKADLKSPIWPVPDLSAGFEFTFADHVVLRLEGGLHGSFFYGGSLGGRF